MKWSPMTIICAESMSSMSAKTVREKTVFKKNSLYRTE